MVVNIITFSKIVVILFLGYLATCITGAPYKIAGTYEQSPFNIGLKTITQPLLRAHDAVNQLKKLLRPTSILNQAEISANKDNTIKLENKNNSKEVIFNKSGEMVALLKVKIDKSCRPVLPCDSDNYKKHAQVASEKVYANKENKQLIDKDKKETNAKSDYDINIKESDIRTQIETTTTISVVDKDKEDFRKNVDYQLLDYIFNNKEDIYGTTTDSTETADYTTGTGDYDFSTTDDLLRIPSAVVATLLG